MSPVVTSALFLICAQIATPAMNDNSAIVSCLFKIRFMIKIIEQPLPLVRHARLPHSAKF